MHRGWAAQGQICCPDGFSCVPSSDIFFIPDFSGGPSLKCCLIQLLWCLICSCQLLVCKFPEIGWRRQGSLRLLSLSPNPVGISSQYWFFFLSLTLSHIYPGVSNTAEFCTEFKLLKPTQTSIYFSFPDFSPPFHPSKLFFFVSVCVWHVTIFFFSR